MHLVIFRRFERLARAAKRRLGLPLSFLRWPFSTTPAATSPTVSIVECRPRGYPYASAYAEVAETVHHGFRRLGFECRRVNLPGEVIGTVIIIGAHCLSRAAARQVPRGAIIYNTEHSSSQYFGRADYARFLKRHQVWDYSQDNAARLGERLGSAVRYVPLGYVSELTRIAKAPEEDIDLLFYGGLNPRREAILGELRARGLNVHHAFGVYGAERDALIARAKVVLNMHFYEPGAFEAVRVCYLLSNRKAVISELNLGEFLDADLAHGIVAVPYGELVAACLSLVNDPKARRDLEERGFAAFSARSEAEILWRSLNCDDPIRTPETPANAQSLYLSLLERCLVNSIYEDRPFDWWSGGAFRPELRETGRDWPSVAHTMIGRRRLNNFRALIEAVIGNNVPGDVIETGVWRGGACIMARAVLKAYGIEDRIIWLADSFQGLPPPDPAYPADANDRHFKRKELAVSLEQVQENFRKYGLLDHQVRFLKGWFKDTLPGAPFEKLAVVRLDGDMYQSTIDAITALYDKLQPGGFIIVDDYGAVAGCRQAITDFRAQRSISDPIINIDDLGVYWQKSA